MTLQSSLLNVMTMERIPSATFAEVITAISLNMRFIEKMGNEQFIFLLFLIFPE